MAIRKAVLVLFGWLVTRLCNHCECTRQVCELAVFFLAPRRLPSPFPLRSQLSCCAAPLFARPSSSGVPSRPLRVGDDRDWRGAERAAWTAAGPDRSVHPGRVRRHIPKSQGMVRVHADLLHFAFAQRWVAVWHQPRK
eukprot:4202483-Prymnesium_polylepis.1